MKKFKPYNPDQPFLLPPVLQDWLPEDHPAAFISEVVDAALDLTPILATYETGDGRGQPPYHPALLVKLLLYGYCTGKPSSRQIEQATYEEIPYRVLAANQHPDHYTLAAFRQTHLAALAGLFLQVLHLCQRAGLVKLGHVACVPANEVGGDFFDYVWLDEKKTKLGIAVADVSGKAMRAAITAVMTSGMIYQEIENGESPKRILRKINRPLFMKIDERMFTALSFAVLDTKKKELRFSNAGQMYPALTRKGSVIMLEVKGARLPLGVKEDVAYEEMVTKLKKGDTVIFYTDGIPEAKNEKDEFYGLDRFKALAGETDGTAQEIRDRILEDVKSFHRGSDAGERERAISTSDASADRRERL